MRTIPSTDLGTLFFGAYRRQVLALLLLRPDESFHLRELARITNTQPGTLRRELTQLVEAGVLSREKMGNLVRYKADPACPIYDELRGIIKKTADVTDVLREALKPLSSPGQPGSNRKAETARSVARRDRATAHRSTT